MQISEEIVDRVTKKLSKEFSRTESCILGAPSRLDELFLNPLIQDHSGSTPETSRNTQGENQGTNEDSSQNDPHPETRISQSLFTQISGPDNPNDNYSHSSQTGSSVPFDLFYAIIMKSKITTWHQLSCKPDTNHHK